MVKFKKLKGTPSVISSDPSCKYGNAGFTTVPLIALSDQSINYKSMFLI